MMVGLTSMYICVTMYFGGLLSWILFPFSLILYILGFIFYCHLRCKVMDWTLEASNKLNDSNTKINHTILKEDSHEIIL